MRIVAVCRVSSKADAGTDLDLKIVDRNGPAECGDQRLGACAGGRLDPGSLADQHDAELVEKVWGDDLRIEGVVVEFLGGVDDLAEHLRDFKPGPQRRVGVLVDHLVHGSKESRIAQGINKSEIGKHVLIVGHPFIDIWQAVKPSRLGIKRWPDVPRHIDWKKGTCQQLGWPHRDQADIARAWKHILGGVRSFADLEPSLLGRVEELIDFVTAKPD